MYVYIYIYIYMCVCVCVSVGRRDNPYPRRLRLGRWLSQDIRLLRGCRARNNHPFTTPSHLHCPSWCNTIARLLGSIRLPFRPPVCMLYTIQYIGDNNIV